MSIPCRQAFTQELLELARKNPLIMALCSDSRGSVTLNQFADELPEQFVEVGIAEQNCVGIAAGLANAGFRPFVTGPACFYSMRSAEQVKVDIAYSKSNVKIIGISGGVSYGALGTSHHSLQDIATMCAIPNLTVILPADAWQTKSMTRVLAKEDGPVYVRMGRGAVADIYGPDSMTGLEIPFQTGKAITLRTGSDLLLVGTGETVALVWQAAALLAERGVQATVLDMATLKPFDETAVLKAAQVCPAVISVEEHSLHGGLGDQIAGLLSQQRPRLMKKFALPDEDLVTGSSAEVFRHYGLTKENIAQQAEILITRSKGGE